MTLGNRIKQLRQQQSMSQPELSEKMGIEQSYLSKLENDKSVPSAEVFNALLDAFSVSIDAFLNNIDSLSTDVKLQQIPQIKAFTNAQKNKNASWLKHYLMGCILIFSIGCGLIYGGSSKHIFSETQYEYSSKGVVYPGEPEDIFVVWRHLMNNDRDAIDAKRKQMYQREKVDVMILPQYEGRQTSRLVEEGSRLYSFIGEVSVPQYQNGLMTALGIVFFMLGVLGLAFQQKFAVLRN